MMIMTMTLTEQFIAVSCLFVICVLRQMIITEIQISTTKIILWATNYFQSVDHGTWYILWKLWSTAFRLWFFQSIFFQNVFLKRVFSIFFLNLSNCVEICAPIKCPIVFQLNSAELCSSRSNLANFLSIFTNGWFYMKEGRWWQYCYVMYVLL